jgi:acyl carrier protein
MASNTVRAARRPKEIGQRPHKRGLVAVVTESARAFNVRLSSRLDRDLDISSLGWTELVFRIERVFLTRLPVRPAAGLRRCPVGAKLITALHLKQSNVSTSRLSSLDLPANIATP